MGAAECGLMLWVRAACVRPAPSMRVCAWSYIGRAIVAKTVFDHFFFQTVCVCLRHAATSNLSPTKLSRRRDKEKEATWSGSEVPGSTYSTPSMSPAL